MEVVRRLGFSMGGDEMRVSWRGSRHRVIAITSLADVGGGRSANETSALT
jgi:hypothetical protein